MLEVSFFPRILYFYFLVAMKDPLLLKFLFYFILFHKGAMWFICSKFQFFPRILCFYFLVAMKDPSSITLCFLLSGNYSCFFKGLAKTDKYFVRIKNPLCRSINLGMNLYIRKDCWMCMLNINFHDCLWIECADLIW